MANEQPPKKTPNIIKAPTYQELYDLAADLQSRLAVLESQISSPPPGINPSPGVKPSPPQEIAPVCADFRLLPDLNRSVPVFTGHETSIAAEDWLGSVDALATINNWPVQYRLQFAKSNFTTAARGWFLTENFRDWSDFMFKFRATFVRTLRMSDRWKVMNERRQGEMEHIADYFYDKLQLCQALNLSLDEIRDHIILGIYSRELALYAMSRSHSSPSALLSDLQDGARLFELRKAQYTSGNQKLLEDKTKKPAVKIQRDSVPPMLSTFVREPVASADKPVFKRSWSDVRCYNCNMTGHIGRDCRKPRKPCSICQSTAHTRGRCPEKPPEAMRVGTSPLVPGQNNFVKSVRFNEILTTCLIDTGSSHVLVRVSLVEQTAATVRWVQRPLYTVGDAHQPSAVTLGETTADIAVDGALGADHPVLIVSDDSIPVDVIIGRSWLELPHVNFYKLRDQIIIETLNSIDPSVVSDTATAETSEIRTALIDADQPLPLPIEQSDINLGAQISESERTDLLQLVNQYRDVFAKSLPELGCTPLLEMDIVEVTGSAPVRQKPYRTSPSDRRAIAEILNSWRSAGIISDSTSPYASPVLLVDKGNGEKRLCVDYRRLNRQTQDQPYPMPDIDDHLSRLAEGRIFTTLDLSNGFLQIPLSEEAKQKTAFVTEETTAKFERMPFGLKGAPGMFQKVMNVVFRDLTDAGLVHVYLDDIIIPSRDWPSMLAIVKRVFDALRKARLTLKPAKCTFGADKLNFLGFTISSGAIRPGPKVHAIEHFPRPRDAHEVRRFLGLTGYFRRFVVNYAKLVAPLTYLTKKDVPYVWGETQQESFVELRKQLCCAPVVRMFDPKATITQVHTDASSVALSGIMLQGPTVTNLHMVYAVSKKTTEAESKYHSSRLELYAVIWTLNRLRPYLLGIRFTVVTDCQSLIYLNMHKTVKPQIARWFEVLQEFEFDIKFRPGERMAHVDALSRATPTSVAGGDLSVNEELSARLDVLIALTPTEKVRFMQRGDPLTRDTIQLVLATRALTDHEKRIVQHFEVHDGVLYRRHAERLLLVVPRVMRKGIVIGAHDFGGHFALDRTVAKILECYWFTGLKRYVKQHIQMCLDCLVHKTPAGKKPGYLHPIPAGRRPFEVVHVDHLGPFETSAAGNRYLFVLVDNLTKFTHLYPCRSTDTASVLNRLDKFCEMRGMPDRIISDRGTCFTGKAFKTYCESRGIKHTLNSTKHPQANGQVERVNRTILPMLSILSDDQAHWDNKVPEVERHLNSAVNKTSTKSPFEALHGYRPRFRGGVLDELSKTRNEWTDPHEVQVQVRDMISKGQDRMKAYYDQRHHQGVRYEVGEIVVMQRQPRPDQPSKLQVKYREKPLQVMEVLPGDTYRVAEVASDGREIYATTAHVSQLKSWKVFQEDDDESQSEGEQEEVRVVRHEVEGEDKDNTAKPKRTRRLPAHLSEYQLN